MMDEIDLRKPLTDPVDKLFTEIQLLCAGKTVEVVWKAECLSFACTIGFALERVEQIDPKVDEIAADLKRMIRDNWSYLAEQRARSDAGMGTA